MIEPLVLTETIEAPRATVFSYFVDPERQVQWMGTVAVLDATPGGTYHLTMRPGLETRGEFVVVEPPTRVVFTFGWPHNELVPPGSTQVEVVLDEVTPTTTRLTLTQTGLPSEAERAHHGQGWSLYLDRLRRRSAGDDPGPDPNGPDGAG